MLLEVTRPVRGGSTGATASTKLQRPLEMAEFHAKPGERCERVNDEPTPVAGVVIALVGIRLRLDGTVDADLVGDPFVFPPGVGLALSVPGGASQKAQPTRVCCITRPPRRRRWRPSSPGGRQSTAWLNRTQYYSARERERGPREPE